MLFSFALTILLGLTLGGIMKRLSLPPLLGMMLCGMLLGPYALNFISGDILQLSADLRQIALIVILLRAGLALDLEELKKVGRPAILMCFLPATFEILAVILLAPPLLGFSLLDAALLGTVLAAVSPAVVVPRMLTLLEKGYGKDKNIPALIMAGASVDDIYVIILFTAFLSMNTGGTFSPLSLLSVPVSVLTGVILGVLSGFLLAVLFKKIHMRDTVKLLLLIAVSLLFISLENFLKPYLSLSGLLAVMSLGMVIFQKNGPVAKRLSGKSEKIWVGAELMLFVLVGATVDLSSLSAIGLSSVLLIVGALVLRVLGVFLCLIGTKLSFKERLFTAIAYLPKATVQAAIGGIPLALGLPAGNAILAVAVLSILITAPLGAIGIDRSYKKLLVKDKTGCTEKAGQKNC